MRYPTMSHPIQVLADQRAHLASVVEYLRGMQPTVSRDVAEAAAYAAALRRAETAYMHAEAEFQRATSTYTSTEIAELLGGRAA
jgi:hypothetical protein